MRAGHIAKGFIQLGFKNLAGWRWHNLSGQPLLVLDCPYDEDYFTFIQSESLLFQLTVFVSHPPIMCHCEEPGFVILITSS